MDVEPWVSATWTWLLEAHYHQDTHFPRTSHGACAWCVLTYVCKGGQQTNVGPAPLAMVSPCPRLTRDMVAVILDPHLVQAFLCGRVSHCDGSILVVSDVGACCFSRRHPDFPWKADTLTCGTLVSPTTHPCCPRACCRGPLLSPEARHWEAAYSGIEGIPS